MPKETVKDISDLFDLKVGWSNQSVQVGLETNDFPTLSDALKAMGDNPKSVWSNLDREGCNRLIRLIRRARDGAFGSDA